MTQFYCEPIRVWHIWTRIQHLWLTAETVEAVINRPEVRGYPFTMGIEKDMGSDGLGADYLKD